MNLSPSAQLLSNSNTEANGSDMDQKNISFNSSITSNVDNVCPMPISEPNTRKLIRSTSTYGEDILDEALNDLSHLNQRHVLRQQWFRKNNLVSRLRRSTSTASNSSSSSSSSSSSGVSSIYSNCNPNTFSFTSSFSSSFSATLSSLSESCDTVDYNSNSFMSNNEPDYPRILRRSSFKNKFSPSYKPYYKPRRFSLQLVKNLELPENFKFCTKTNLFDLKNSLNSSLVKNSMSCYSMNDKENSSFHLKTAKSNPSSPVKSCHFSRGDTCITMNEDRDLPISMQTQIVITNLNQNSQIGDGDTSQQLNSNGQAGLVRSKSLDDLNTLIYCSNSSPSSGQDNDHLLPNPNMISQAASHHSSFNRIAFCDYAKSNNLDQPLNPSVDSSTNNTNQSQLLYFSACPSSNLLSTPDLALESFSSANMNNQKCMSFSSNEIFNSGQFANIGGNNNEQDKLQQSNQPTSVSTSQCDIDNVLKKISSLRV